MAAGSCGRAWLVSMVLLAVPIVTQPPQHAGLGPPGGPSPPSCHIPFDESGLAIRSAIQCVWDPGSPSRPSNYTLHWRSADGRVQSVRGSNSSASIQYDLVFSLSDLSVWVQAESQDGVVLSPESTFNTANIMKPATPAITKHDVEPLEIYWESRCSELGVSEHQCEVRHRAALQAEGWSEAEGGLHGLYCLEDVLPYSRYEFQVRCSCLGTSWSDWSQTYAAESPGAAPVGMLDVWSDCPSPALSSGCVPMWKVPPRWQAGGEILRYVLTLSLRNGTQTVVNASATGRLTSCDTQLCHFTGGLTDVTAVTVSAHTAHGATEPARLHIPLSAQENHGEALQLKVNPEGVVVSWNAPNGYRNNQSEHVVQYKQAGQTQTKGFDWIRLQRSQMSAIITGQFEKYTPYRVALFSVYPNGSSQHLSSAVGYVAQGTPPQVAWCEVVSVRARSMLLAWQPVPLPQSRGLVLGYQIGVNGHGVHNVSWPQGDGERGVFLLEHLKPGRDYEVWIRAVTEAGPGPKSTMTFKTEGFDLNVLFALVVFIPFISFFLMRKFSWVLKKSIGLVKVPDPSNSQVFQKIDLQINSYSEPILTDPVLSDLEIIPQREDCYSKMADSEDEDTEAVLSDYERHFIPTAMDIMVL